MSKYWPYIHREGHLRAQILHETDYYVGIQYEHVTDPSWAGNVSLTKEDFNAAYKFAERPA